MHVAIVSTYPPRQCGIATFSSDLYHSIVDVEGVDEVSVIAVTDGNDLEYPRQVVTTIQKEERADYVRAARLTGRLGIDVVMVEHEYGIFGGRSGDYLLSLAAELPVPYVVTLHTVLSEPGPREDAVLRELCRRAASVLVFTDSARRLVVSSGVAPDERVVVVPHGAPAEICRQAHPDGPKRVIPIRGQAGIGRADTGGRFVLSTFGLLSPGKGVETTIEAVAKLVPRHPELLLVLAGRTHPEVAKRDGEQYRLGLQAQVRELDIGGHVTFDDRFLGVGDLSELLAATDVFVTAYRNAEQTVSGALTFAVAAGCPVVSTPYRYANDLLSAGAGKLVGFDDSDALAQAIEAFIEDPEDLRRARRAACAVGAALTWASVGRSTAEILRRAADELPRPEAPLVEEQPLPPLRFDHLLTLVDPVGIVQHASGVIPDRSTGYCVDDVARLLRVTEHLATRTAGERWTEISLRAIAFLGHAARAASGSADGSGNGSGSGSGNRSGNGSGMHNFMSYERRWIDEPTVGDHVGRSIWALGDVLVAEPPRSIAEPATALLDQLCADLATSAAVPPRTAAYAILGLAPLVDHLPRHRDLAIGLTAQLIDLHDAHATDDWQWFEDELTYDNARLSQALIVAGRSLPSPRAAEVGLASLSWYGEQCELDGSRLVLPGHRGRHRGHRLADEGAEQPLDASALVEAEIEALRSTGEPERGRRAFRAFGWFLGRNRLGVPLYDAWSGGCRDGLEATQASTNEGAESTLAYWSARLALEAAGLPVVARRHAANHDRPAV